MRVIPLIAVATVAFSQQYPFVDVTGDARPSSFMLLDHRGGLWVNGGGALRYFDGQHFFSINDPALPSGTGGYLAEDSEGGLWISTGSLGLYRFYKGSLRKMYGGYSRDIVAVRPGLMLVFTGPPGAARPLNPDIYRFAEDRGQWTGVKLADWKGRSGDYPKVDRNGNVTYACDHAWCELPAQTIADWRPGSRAGPIKRPDPYPGLESILRDQFGCVWFRSPTLSASYQCPGDPALTELPVEIAGTNLDMWESADGSIWLPSGSRLAVGRPGHFRVIRAANGLPDANHVVVSPDGTAWLSGTNGLFRWQYPFRAEFWNARDGLDLPYSPLGVAGRMFAISGSGLAALSAGRNRWLTLGENAKLGLRKLFPGPGSTLYATSTRAGVVQFDLDGALLAQSHTRLPTSFYQYLVPRTPLGPIWFSDTQISRLTRNGRELRFALAPLSAAPDQKLAACYAGGLVTLDGSETHHVSTSDGLLEHSCMCLKILPNGDVWYGYISADAFALIRRDNAGRVEVRQYHTGDDHTFSFDADSRRWIWRGGVNAMHVADPMNAQDGNWIDLNATDGFRSSVLAEAFFADSDGSVWWGTQDSSVYHFTPPPDFARPTHPPQVFLSGYSWNGGPPQFAEAVRTIPYGANLTALVGSLQFDRRNAMRFRYRLTPDQPSWRDTRSFDIAVGKLHWGSHKLELQAKLLNGPWSAIQSEVFEVAQPFWATWPFLFGCAGVGLSGAAAGYRWRRKLRARAEKAFPNLAEWRLAAFSPEAHGLIGQVLDSRYRLNRVIARGGFATVLDGIDLAERNRPCAVKVFRRELSDKDWLKSHFEREVSALAQVQHPNVVRIYSHGTTPTGAPYLAMEFIAGQTLRELLNEGPLSARHSATLLRQAGAALEAIHACGICHRDVKPENLMIRSAGPVEASLIVIDFSIAIVRKPDETIHGLSRAAGTIYYMAPEQAIGYADVTTDIYSLAKVLLEMLTGARLSDLLPDASMDLPNRVRELLLELPVRLSMQSIDLIASALEFDPARRPRSVRDFAELIAVDLEKG